jgi:hypothetical protein
LKRGYYLGNEKITGMYFPKKRANYKRQVEENERPIQIANEDWFIRLSKVCGWESIEMYPKMPFKIIKDKEESEKKSRNIPKRVQREVWQRDKGRCIECGGQERLEFDHIIPFSKGGSNTARNIQLLCENCNRKKSNNI